LCTGNGFITVSLQLQITHEVFFVLPNSFLAIIVDLIKFLYSEAHIPAGWCFETQLFSLFCSIEFFFVSTLHGPNGKRRQPFSLIILGVFIIPSHSNGGGVDHVRKK
jgi:hypothetical protein